MPDKSIEPTQPELDYATVLADLNRLPERAAKNLRNVFALLTERAGNTLQVSRASIWLFTDAQRTTLRCIDCYELNNGTHSADATLDVTDVPNYTQALRRERVIIADDASADPRTAEFADSYLSEHDIKSVLDAPIRQDGEVVGVICLEQIHQDKRWREEEANFVATMSDFATIALLSHHKNLAETALVQAQKMESLGRLAGGIAHDFNNILTVITGAVETLQLDSDDGDESNRMLKLIGEASERARRLTRNLLAFGGDQNLAFKQLSTHELLDGVRSLAASIARDNITFNFNKGPTPFWINGDQTQLEQVLLNLMINAMEAMPDGGQLTIEVLAPNEEDRIGIAVADSGRGIDRDARDKIFEPFFSTKGEFGSGLGLSIALGVLQQHGGNLQLAESSPAGTRFEVWLPRAATVRAVNTSPQPAPETNEPAQRARVLLVDDEASVRDIVGRMLTSVGYEPIVSDNATHALELLGGQTVDLLLSDVVMPDMRGPDLYQEARKLQPNLSVLFMSGYSEEVIAEVPSGTNKVGYLSKPFTLKQLKTALGELITEQPSRGQSQV